MPKRVEETPSGVVVVRDAYGPVWPGALKEHRFSAEDRKARREDNKAMAEIRKKTRGRKKHGRHR